MHARSMFAALAIGAMAAVLGGCPSTTPLPEKITVIGTADYVAVPADGLAIRRADHRAFQLLRRFAQGVRYIRIGRNFSTAPGALPDVRPSQIQIYTRDAVFIDGEWQFIVIATCDLASTYSDEQLATMGTGFRYTQPLSFSEDLQNPARNLTDVRLFEACMDSIARALELHYGSQLIDARGRAFVLAMKPRIKPYPAADLPRDPGDLALKPLEYRYRLGTGFQSANATGITFDIEILIVPDKR